MAPTERMEPKERKLITVICLILAAITLLCYWPCTHHGFISFHDPGYLIENPHVNAGLTWSGVAWAFRTASEGNWHPATWISHMVDCQLYGLSPGGHHLTNLLFHVGNTILVFMLLRLMTGAIWRSALVAALFAWHPLHVESVAWASERKDVLSTCFFLLTLMAYAAYVGRSRQETGDRRQEAEDRRQETGSWVRRSSFRFYVLALALFALALMSKSMVVTLPFILLLLDFWPLKRFHIPVRGSSESTLKSQTADLKVLALEKVPFFVLATAASIVTFMAQKTGGAVATLDGIPLGTRLATALVSYARYVIKGLWPTDLAIIYPYQDHVSLAAAMAAGLLLLLCSVLVFLGRARYPYLLMGWCWFLGTLVPVIGLVQVGSQSIADRYMYIPSIGLFVVLVWGVSDVVRQFPRLKCFAFSGACSACVLCLSLASLQLSYWQNGIKLFGHALEVTQNNYIACEHLGSNLYEVGRKEEALFYYTESLRIRPRRADAEYNVGTLLLELGRASEAVAHLSAAAQLDPRNAQTQLNLALALVSQGKANYSQAAVVAEKARKLALVAGQTLLANKASQLLKLCGTEQPAKPTSPKELISSSGDR